MMLRKVMIVLILFLLVASFSKSAGATSVSWIGPNGYYEIVGGKISAKVDFPQFFKITLDLPNLKNINGLLGGCFVFYCWGDGYTCFDETEGPFAAYIPLDLTSIIPLANQAQLQEDIEPSNVGVWYMTSATKFAVIPTDSDGNQIDMEQTINDLLATQEFPLNMISVEITKYSFTGSVNKSGSLKASLSLGISINAFITTGTISLTGSFTTATGTSYPPETDLPFILSASNKNIKNIKASPQELANMVVKFLKMLPIKNMIPAQ